jgi:hypothetical protein
MPNKTKTALAALFILGPVSVVVLAGPNNRTDDHGSVRRVLVSNGRTGVVNHAAKPFAAEEKPWAAARARDATQWEQNYNGYYRGYPLEDWYRTDGW